MRRMCQAVVGLVLFWLFAAAPAFGQESPLIKIKETAVIDPLGDGKFSLEIKLPADVYTRWKSENPNTAVILRRLGLGSGGWEELEGVKGAFADGSSCVNIEWTVRGLARMSRQGYWETPILNSDSLEPISVSGTVASLAGASQTGLGLAMFTIKVTVPEGAQGLRLLESPTRLAYRLPAARSTDGQHPSVAFTFQSKPQIMTCLAKCYANPGFTRMWAARTVFQNTGDQTIHDYRIRFRITDFTSAWSPWQQCAAIMPGQTVVDPFFPILDLSKMATLNSSRRAALEVEYEYRRADGDVVRETDSRTIELLGRNEVYYSSRPRSEQMGFLDATDYVPAILGAFTTRDDPVIQQVAGWVSGQTGGNAAALSDTEAMKFLEALYDFMVSNEIAYQTPPSSTVNGQLSQHVKYGRDVLRNRAGTCIDLAIFYASVCEAVGLEPTLFVVPGHCFVGVQLPQNRKLYGVEATMIGRATFQQALKKGNEEVQSARKDGKVWEVNIPAMRKLGVHGLDLPALPPTTLKDWGIKRVKATPGAVDKQLIGRWNYTDNWDGSAISYTLTLDGAGNFTESVKVTKANGEKIEANASGTYETTAKSLIFNHTSGEQKGQKVSRIYKWSKGDLWLTLGEIGYQIRLTRQT